MIEIHVQDDKGVSIKHNLQAGKHSIGKAADADIVLADQFASKYHAELHVSVKEVVIKDLGSTNGTFVNSISIAKCVLRNNDQIEIGEAKIVFVEVETRQR